MSRHYRCAQRLNVPTVTILSQFGDDFLKINCGKAQKEGQIQIRNRHVTNVK